MERTFNTIKLVAFSALVVVALLSLSYSNAYGYSAAIGAKKPSTPTLSNNSAGTTGTDNSFENQFAGHNWDRDTYVTHDNSNSSLPPSTVPEPGTLILLGTGLIGIAKFVRRRS